MKDRKENTGTSRSERWTHEQKMLKTQQENKQIIQAALDSGLINKNFTIGELHAKLSVPPTSTDLWYVLVGSRYFMVATDRKAVSEPNPCEQQDEAELRAYNAK